MSRVTGRPVEILLVEDNPGDVQLTRAALREAKVRNHLHVATDGEEAMAFLRNAGGTPGPRPDLILLDLNLPKKHGHEVLEEIKSSAGLRQIPVIILTTSREDEDVLRSYDLSANCYITKPVDFRQLLRIVQSIESFWFTIVTLPPEKPL